MNFQHRKLQQHIFALLVCIFLTLAYLALPICYALAVITFSNPAPTLPLFSSPNLHNKNIKDFDFSAVRTPQSAASLRPASARLRLRPPVLAPVTAACPVFDLFA